MASSTRVQGDPDAPGAGWAGDGVIWLGATTLVAEGLVSATGLAVNAKGDLFVSQLFAGQIAKVKKGSDTPRPWLAQPLPGDVEWSSRGVHATVNVLPPEQGKPNGKVIHVR